MLLDVCQTHHGGSPGVRRRRRALCLKGRSGLGCHSGAAAAGALSTCLSVLAQAGHMLTLPFCSGPALMLACRTEQAVYGLFAFFPFSVHMSYASCAAGAC